MIKTFSFEKYWDLDTYKDIMQCVNKANYYHNNDFRHKFNRFYRVRRNGEWQNSFYDLFPRAMNYTDGFAEMLDAMHKKTGCFEASYISKMLATVDCKMPIYDKNVLNFLGISVPEKKTVENLTAIYEKITNKNSNYADSQKGKEYIGWFDDNLSDYKNISSTKKVDFLFWTMGSESNIDFLVQEKLSKYVEGFIK